MRCTQEELALKDRFEAFYSRSRAPVMLAVERSVCGCDYGGNSWTTRATADDMTRHLGLGPGVRLLELGAGSGWPGLYQAGTSGCDVVLVDLPETGLRIARERAAQEGIGERVETVVADASDLPFAEQSFDAISHSDLLCCLPRKRAVLEGCRRIIRAQGRMVFTVISVAPGLTPDSHARAVRHAPDYVESESDYPAMLAATGWKITGHEDLTEGYIASGKHQIEADEDHREGLETLLGRAEAAERLADWRVKLAAMSDGLYLRELFVAAPAPDRR